MVFAESQILSLSRKKGLALLPSSSRLCSTAQRSRATAYKSVVPVCPFVVLTKQFVTLARRRMQAPTDDHPAPPATTFVAEPASTADFSLDENGAELGIPRGATSMPVPAVTTARSGSRRASSGLAARSTSTGANGDANELRQRPLRSMTAPNLGQRDLHHRPQPKTQPTKPLFTKELLVPKVPVGKPPGWRTSGMNIIKYSWLNVLLVFIPVSWAMHFSHQGSTITFVMSFLAIIPLAALLGFATEELALRVGDTIGGLMNCTFGNAVELIIAILALVKGEVRVVQAAMIGSVLSNSLLVLGTCQFVGGLRFHEQPYAMKQAQVNINALGLAINAIVIPVAFHVFRDLAGGTGTNLTTADTDVLHISHGIAIILLFVYLGYMMFQFWTHSYLYAPTDPSSAPIDMASPTIQDGPQPPANTAVFRMPSWGSSSDGESSISSVSNEEDEHAPKLSLYGALALLFTVTILAGFTAEWVCDPRRVSDGSNRLMKPSLRVSLQLVGAIEGLTATGAVGVEFVSLILLPLVGNAAEHVTAVTVAGKGKLDLAMSVAVGSSLQILLLVIPILILLGWAIGQPLSLYFDPFETLILFLAVVSVNWAIADSRTNWFEGLTLMCIYVIIALVIFYYDGIDNLSR
ncbi:BQ5605_C012g06942 [Microbotryum silenes-dioicae]|uniref:BQ5605_C012g06942 protein n=1 Tax=Microbotryum silenes-dioicae TaxID=796604 RepID=A0A2X0LWY7_9BASI|nr:BQ5605_C012g06942 [Microbotryum silenes-dioicae]